MQLMQAFELVVNRHQLITDVAAVIDPREGQQHGFDLSLAVDQHAALCGSGLVGHGADIKAPLLHRRMALETVVFVTGRMISDCGIGAARLRLPVPVQNCAHHRGSRFRHRHHHGGAPCHH